MVNIALLQSTLSQKSADYFTALTLQHQELTAVVLPERLLSFSSLLRDSPEYDFKSLVDITAVDYLTYGQAEWSTTGATTTGFSRGVSEGSVSDEAIVFPGRFAVVIHLLSLTHKMRLRLKVFLPFISNNETPTLDSLTGIWPSANWPEREVFDLFGIVFRGHPDLRRILTDYDFVGHPFRKDFPLIGETEVRYDQAAQKVVREPVSIEPRVLVPKVVRRGTCSLTPDEN